MNIFFSNQAWEFLFLGCRSGILLFTAQKNFIRSLGGNSGPNSPSFIRGYPVGRENMSIRWIFLITLQHARLAMGGSQVGSPSSIMTSHLPPTRNPKYKPTIAPEQPTNKCCATWHNPERSCNSGGPNGIGKSVTRQAPDHGRRYWSIASCPGSTFPQAPTRNKEGFLIFKSAQYRWQFSNIQHCLKHYRIQQGLSETKFRHGSCRWRHMHTTHNL